MPDAREAILIGIRNEIQEKRHKAALFSLFLIGLLRDYLDTRTLPLILSFHNVTINNTSIFPLSLEPAISHSYNSLL